MSDTIQNDRLPKRFDADPKNPGYREQFGVVVLCDDEANQRAVYDRLRAEGLKLKVVTV